MKKNQNLSSTISLKALEAKALKAAAVAELHAQLRTPRPSKKKPRRQPQRSAIELEINAIYQALKHNASETETVVIERLGIDSLCRARISVYRKDHLLRQTNDVQEFRRLVAAGADRRTLRRPFRALPQAMYAFYGSSLFPERLGSVAIYGDNPHATLTRIRVCGHFAGHAVKRASIEMGRRPFVDITLSA